MKIKVCIADEQTAVRHLLMRFIAEDLRCKVVGDTNTGHQAIKIGRRLKPDLFVLDVELPEISGVEVIDLLRRDTPNTKVLVFTGTTKERLRVAAMNARPDGFVQKQDPLDTLRDAFRTVLRGGRYFSASAPRSNDKLLGCHQHREATLTPCERCVIQMVAEGFTTKEIAVRLSVSPRTIEHHRANLMKKVGVHNAAGLTRFAMLSCSTETNGLAGNAPPRMSAIAPVAKPDEGTGAISMST